MGYLIRRFSGVLVLGLVNLIWLRHMTEAPVCEPYFRDFPKPGLDMPMPSQAIMELVSIHQAMQEGRLHVGPVRHRVGFSGRKHKVSRSTRTTTSKPASTTDLSEVQTELPQEDVNNNSQVCEKQLVVETPRVPKEARFCENSDFCRWKEEREEDLMLARKARASQRVPHPARFCEDSDLKRWKEEREEDRVQACLERKAARKVRHPREYRFCEDLDFNRWREERELKSVGFDVNDLRNLALPLELRSVVEQMHLCLISHPTMPLPK